MKLEYDTTIKAMQVNIKGMKQNEKRYMVEQYMKENDIGIAILIETHTNTNHKETKKLITYYIAGGDTKDLNLQEQK